MTQDDAIAVNRKLDQEDVQDFHNVRKSVRENLCNSVTTCENFHKVPTGSLVITFKRHH
jgi:hypothetical protein